MPRTKKITDLSVGGDKRAKPPSPDGGDSRRTHRPRLKLSLRLMHGDEIALGPGKAELLEAIAQTGSISQAGRNMNMSYRRAWLLVDTMNRCFKTPLVETSKGGSHGGGARLSALGEEVLVRYRAMDAAAKQVASAYMGLFENLMNESPPQSASPLPGDAADRRDANPPEIAESL